MEKVLQLPQKNLVHQRNVTGLIQRQQSVVQTQLSVPKSIEKTKTKEKCIVVPDIFSQVDEALQKRKADNSRLLEEVSDRENQLNYLQQQTKDQSFLNAAQSVAISVSEDNLVRFDQEIIEFYQNVLEGAQENHEEFKTDSEESEMILQSLTNDFEALLVFKNEAFASIALMVDEVEDGEKYIHDKEIGFCAIQNKISELKLDVEVLENKRQALRSEAEQVQTVKASLEIECNSLQDELAANKKDIDSMHCTEDAHKERLSQLRVELETSSALIALTKLELDTEHSASATRIMEATDRLLEATVARDALCAELEGLKRQEGERIAHLTETELSITQHQGEATALRDQIAAVEIEMTSAETALMAATAALEETRAKSADDAQKSEYFYQMTCLRMKELRDLHQRQPAVEHELLLLQSKLDEAIAAETSRLEHITEELVTVEKTLRQEQAQAILQNEQSASVTAQIMVAFATEIRVLETFANLEEQLMELAADELWLEDRKRSATEKKEGEMDKQREVDCLTDSILSAEQHVGELEAARLALNDQLSGTSSELASLTQPASLNEEWHAELESELTIAQSALEIELQSAMQMELEDIQACRQKLALAIPEVLQSVGNHVEIELMNQQLCEKQTKMAELVETLTLSVQATEMAVLDASRAAHSAVKATTEETVMAFSATARPPSTQSHPAGIVSAPVTVARLPQQDFDEPPEAKRIRIERDDAPHLVKRVSSAAVIQTVVSPRKSNAVSQQKKSEVAELQPVANAPVSGIKRKMSGSAKVVEKSPNKHLGTNSQSGRLSGADSTVHNNVKMSPAAAQVEERTKQAKLVAPVAVRPSQSSSQTASIGTSGTKWDREGFRAESNAAALSASDAATRLAVARGQSKALSDSSMSSSQSTKTHKPSSSSKGTFHAMPAPKSIASVPVKKVTPPTKVVSTQDWFNDDDSLFG